MSALEHWCPLARLYPPSPSFCVPCFASEHVVVSTSAPGSTGSSGNRARPRACTRRETKCTDRLGVRKRLLNSGSPLSRRAAVYHAGTRYTGECCTACTRSQCRRRRRRRSATSSNRTASPRGPFHPPGRSRRAHLAHGPRTLLPGARSAPLARREGDDECG